MDVATEARVVGSIPTRSCVLNNDVVSSNKVEKFKQALFAGEQFKVTVYGHGTQPLYENKNISMVCVDLESSLVGSNRHSLSINGRNGR